MTSRALDTLRRLVEDEPRAPDDHDLLGPLERLCRVAARELDVSGVGVSLLWGPDDRVVVAASGATSVRMEGLQLMLGEGPCLHAFTQERPVLVPDLAEVTDFPVYARAALDMGVCAVFALPLRLHGRCAGVLDVYRRHPGALSPEQAGLGLVVAELAVELVLAVDEDADSVSRVLEEMALDLHDTLHVAQGMVMAQLLVSQDEALALLRAHAFGSDSSLGETCVAVIERRLVLGSDDA